ncbi:nucleotidyltransferase domain-containing protein [Bifidobacterium imperatoris]|uniref:Nucleotidyltransferase domain-containing protein n=2 Tax=Bifidobacterium imperatoris TaxID=2020965 RepID=A0ABX7S3X9_9BIFI|nr:nucleotidyltransferase domain-containing protein [Bifidobacterium imperatoris]QSY58406.1 nucleotidyltransferase domain-containing protein [Bifidobacterium imperatoris]
MKTVAELREERVRSHISQSEAARSMGTTQSALSRAEREGNPTQDFLQRYERALATLAGHALSHKTTDADANVGAGAANASQPTAPANSTLEIVTLKLIVSRLVERHHIAEMYVYGSVARGDARPDSDVDLIYRLKPGASYSIMEKQQLIDDLESTLGRTVSLISYDSLLRHAKRSRASKRFLDHITPDLIKVA